MATPDGDGRQPGAAKPPASWPARKSRDRRRWQRWLFGLLGVAWLVIGLVIGFAVGNWTVAALWLGLAAMELVLWIMAGRR